MSHMIQLIIGRDSSSNRLQIIHGEKSHQFGPIGSVPKSVSKQHCVLTLDEDNHIMTIKNNKIENRTYVNGVQIETCKVTEKDVIELGYEHYTLSWNYFSEFIKSLTEQKPQDVDIRHLKNIWKDYKHQQDKLQSSQTITNVLSRAVPILTIGSVAAGIFLGKTGGAPTLHTKIIYCIAIFVLILVFIKSLYDARRIPKRREKINQEMLTRYTCPKCNYFFGYQPYDVIKSNLDNCPKCKSKLKK